MKRNKMDLGAILLIVGAVIVAMVIVIWALSANGILKKSGNDTIGQASQLFSGYSDEAVAKYDGNVVGGEEVIAALDTYTAEAGVSVVVKTKLDSAGTTYTSTSKYSAPAKTDNKYINPDGVFEGKVTLNSNNIVTTITFTQK